MYVFVCVHVYIWIYMSMLLCAKNISGSRNKELETDLLGRGIGWTGHEVGRWRFTFPCLLFDTFEFYIVHYLVKK